HQSGDEHGRKRLLVARLVSIQRGAGYEDGGADKTQVRHLGPIRDEARLWIGDHRRADSIPHSECVADGEVAGVAPLFSRISDLEIADGVGRVVAEAETVGDGSNRIGSD